MESNDSKNLDFELNGPNPDNDKILYILGVDEVRSYARVHYQLNKELNNLGLTINFVSLLVSISLAVSVGVSGGIARNSSVRSWSMNP